MKFNLSYLSKNFPEIANVSSARLSLGGMNLQDMPQDAFYFCILNEFFDRNQNIENFDTLVFCYDIELDIDREE